MGRIKLAARLLFLLTWAAVAQAVSVVDETDGGEIRLYFENDRPGFLEVFLRAARR